MSSESGWFWFFSGDNGELFAKLLDGCGINDRFWFYAAGLTDVQVEISVEDLVSGTKRTYRNPQATPFAPIQDTGAFASCPHGG